MFVLAIWNMQKKPFSVNAFGNKMRKKRLNRYVEFINLYLKHETS